MFKTFHEILFSPEPSKPIFCGKNSTSMGFSGAKLFLVSPLAKTFLRRFLSTFNQIVISLKFQKEDLHPQL